MRRYRGTKAYLHERQTAWAIHYRYGVVRVRIIAVEAWGRVRHHRSGMVYYSCEWIKPPKRLTQPEFSMALWRGAGGKVPWFPAPCHFGHALDLGTELFMTRREANQARFPP